MSPHVVPPAGLQIHLALPAGGGGQHGRQSDRVPLGDGLAVGPQAVLQPFDDLCERRGVHGEQLGPQGYVQGGHPGAVPKGVPLEAPAVEQVGVVAHRHRHHVHELAGVCDDGVVVLRGGAHHVPAATVLRHPLQQGNVLRLAVLPGGHDEVGVPEQGGLRVVDAG